MRQFVVWNEDFHGGFVSADQLDKYSKSSWSGRNVFVDRDGNLACRTGLKRVLPSSGSIPTGTVKGMGYFPSTGKELWFIVGTSVYQIAQFGSGPVVTVSGSLDVEPTFPVDSVTVGYDVYITVQGDGIYKLSPISSTLTKLTSLGGGTCIAYKNGRLHVGGIPEIASVDVHMNVYYSEYNDFNTWDSAQNYIPGQDESPVQGLFVVRDTIYVSKGNGMMYTVSGGAPAFYTQRLVALSGAPTWPWTGAIIGGNKLISKTWGDGQAMQPGIFNGVKFDHMAHLSNLLFTENYLSGIFAGTGLFTNVGILETGADGEVAIVYTHDAGGIPGGVLVYTDKVWANHVFAQRFTGCFSCSAFVPGSGRTGAVSVTDGGGPGVVPKFFVFDPVVQRQGGDDVTGNPSDAGDGIDALIKFPWWSEPQDRDIIVKEVILDVLSIPTGDSVDNTITVTVEGTPHGRFPENAFPTSGFTDTQSQTFTLPAPSSEQFYRLRAPISIENVTGYRVTVAGTGFVLKRYGVLIAGENLPERGY